jgi:hypothetical protein
MKSLIGLLAAAVGVTVVSPPVAVGQEVENEEAAPDCEQICRAFPSRAPAECACMLINPGMGSGSKPIDYENLTARDVIEMERDAYRERMAGIRDYWMIEHSNISPLPTVIVYEKNPPGMSPPYRIVPPPELQRRWNATDPNMTAEQRAAAEAVGADPASVLDVYAMGADRLGEDGARESPIAGALAGELAKLSQGFRDAAKSIRQQQAEEAKEKEQGDGEFQQLADYLREMFNEPSDDMNKEIMLGVYTPLASDGSREPRKTYHTISDANLEEFVKIDYPSIACFVVRLDGPVAVQNPGDPDDPTPYWIDRAELWVTALWVTALGKPGPPVPIFLRMEVRRLAVGGYQRVVVERETTRWNWDSDRRLYFAEQIKESVRGLSEALPEVKKRVEVGGVNDGGPTRQQYMEATTSQIGVPGADPTRDARP